MDNIDSKYLYFLPNGGQTQVKRDRKTWARETND